MNALEIGHKMVEMVNQGRESEEAFVRDYYADDIVSIEGGDSEGMPGRLEGIEAVLGKHAWWYDNNDVHSSSAEGPYVGHRDDQFILRFILDITPKGGERSTLTEVGLFTLEDGKIAQEEYLYLMG